MSKMCNNCLLTYCSYEPCSEECQSARHLEGEYVYFELNHWVKGTGYPDAEPFISWMSDYYKTPEEESKSWIRTPEIMDKWFKENGLVVVISNVDMSVNFCVTAKRDWVKENCPELLTKYTEFIRTSECDETPNSQFGCPFLEYSKENLGLHHWNGSWVEKL